VKRSESTISNRRPRFVRSHQAKKLVTETFYQGFQRRQCARKNAQLHFTVGGVDEKGRFFEEPIITSDISECGGSFSSAKEIPVGATLKLSAPKGFLSLIKIAWHNKHQSLPSVNYGFSFLNPLEEELTSIVPT